MADRDLTFRIAAGQEWKTTAAALRAIDGDLADQLRKQMVDALSPFVAQVKRNVRDIPAAGRSGSTGLRRRIARGVVVRGGTRGEPNLRVVATMENPQEQNLPAYLDDPAGWRHPVFGNRHKWVSQHTGGSWFADTLDRSEPDIQQRLRDVLDAAARTVAAAAGG